MATFPSRQVLKDAFREIVHTVALRKGIFPVEQKKVLKTKE